MRLSARAKASRANAMRSTGPKSKEGKSRSAQNALKHGLTIPAAMLPEYAPAIEAYVAQLVTNAASDALRAAAIAYAEAQVDVDRVRRSRQALYADEEARKKKIPVRQQLNNAKRMLDLCERIEAIQDDLRPIYEFREGLPAVAEFLQTFRLTPETPTLEAGIGVLASKLCKLWRYERRALSRRDKAAKRFQALCSASATGG